MGEKEGRVIMMYVSAKYNETGYFSLAADIIHQMLVQ